MTALADAGHVYPALGLARELARRGHEVTMQIASERWRGAVESSGIDFEVVPSHVSFAERELPGRGPTLAELARRLAPRLEAMRPDVVINDAHGYAHALAAELAGARRATLIATLYPVFEPGLPPYPFGLKAPRTPIGRAGWRAAAKPIAEHLMERGRSQLNHERREAGLPAVERFDSQISDQLTMVATFPHLEYPRRWPDHVHVVGPILAGTEHPVIELPAGDDPLVAVSTSTVFDPELRLVRAAIEGLASEPVRVVAALSREGEVWDGPVPDNAIVVDWIDYEQLMGAASAVVTSGGHGTVVRALWHARPLLVCPAGADQGENGVRVAWSGAGLNLPPRLLAPSPLRWAVRKLLADRRIAARVGEMSAWARARPAPGRAAELIEGLVDGQPR